MIADLETDGEGKFDASGISDGEYRLEIVKPNFISVRMDFKSPSATLSLRMVRAGAIAGRVTTADGKAVTGATVLALNRESEVIARAEINQGGEYRLHGLRPGDYRLAASYGASPSRVGMNNSAPTGRRVGSGLAFYPANNRPQSISIFGGEDLKGFDFVVSPGALAGVSGKVEVSGPGKTFWVALTAVDQPTLATAVAIAQEDGTFRLEGVPQGSYYIFASGPSKGYSMMGAVLDDQAMFARGQVDVRGQDVKGIRLTPMPGVLAKVRLTVDPEAASDCPTSAQVSARNLEDWASVSMTGYSVNAQRSQDTSLAGLAPSRYSLRAAGLGEHCYQDGDTILDVTKGESSASIRLAGAGTVRGRLNAAAPAEWIVVLLSVSGESMVRSVRAGSDGAFSFAALPPGRYRLGASKSTVLVGKGSTEITVAGGRSLEVDLAVSDDSNKP